MVRRFVIACVGLFPITIYAHDWCTHSPDMIPLPITPDFVDIAEVCRSHDICYFTLGASKYSCDRQFLNDFRLLCKENYSDWSQALHRVQCLGYAEVYYEGMISGAHSLDRKSFMAAQSDAETALGLLSHHLDNASRFVNHIAFKLAHFQADGFSVNDSIHLTVQEILQGDR